MTTPRTDSHSQPPRLSRLPIQVRPRLGEGTESLIRRLARANHLPYKYLLRVLCRRGSYGTPDLDLLAQVTGQTVTNLRRALPDAPGRVDSDPTRTCVFSTALDRRLTDSPTRLNLVMLLFDAYQDGIHRHQLSTLYGLDRRIVRIALQYQQPRGPMRHTHNLITLLAAIDPAELHEMLAPVMPAPPP
ncbi:hypothetical protein ACFW2X_33050 [Streptomyces antibioticus]|uniref:hypothetical protein n=1 Tax=Streptomyces antibioticus TaxID=1890 RepID=UPI0036B3B99A